MNIRIRPSTSFISLIVMGVLVFAAGLMYILMNRPVQAQQPLNGRLITVHDRGTETVFLTDKNTVKEALENAGIAVDSRDAVEPALDETLVARDYQVNIYRARPVTVIDGATKQRVITPYQTAEQIAADVGITLYKEDTTTISQSNNIIANGVGIQLEIDRATVLSVDLFGKKTDIRTQGTTIADFLKEKNITLGADDRVSVPLSTPATNGLEVRIWREGKQTISVDEPIPFTTEQERDADRPVGYKEVKTAGVNGKRTVTYEVTVQNGVEVGRVEIAAITLEQAISQVELIGSKVALNVTYSADRAAIMTAAGVAAGDQDYAAYIINNENGLWCPIRWQGTAGCADAYYEKFAGAESSSQVGYGLCQATPGIKMATAGADWRTNVVTQMKWCHSYAISRYGSWEAAYRAKVTKGWW